MDAAGGDGGEITSMISGGLLVANSRNIGWLFAYVGVGPLGCSMVGLLATGEVRLAAPLSWLLALVLYGCCAALTNLPPTAGFVGQLYLLDATQEAHRLGLALVLASSFPLLLYACLQMLSAVFAQPMPETSLSLRWDVETLVVLLLSVMGNLGSGTMALGATAGCARNRCRSVVA